VRESQLGVDAAEHGSDVGSGEPGTLDHLREIASRVRFLSAMIVSSMPHGRLQAVRASTADASLVRTYNREQHAGDAWTWQASRSGQPVRWSRDQGAPPFGPDWARQFAVAHAVVMPAGVAVAAGYPAALHVYRTDSESAFSDAEIALLRARLVETGNQLESPRLFVLSKDLAPLVHVDAWEALDSRLRESILEHAKSRLSDLADEPVLIDRRAHPIGRAGLQTVRYIISRSNAAHPGGPGVIICLQPSVEEWLNITPESVPSHAELARFLPALRYMREGAGSNLTLADVAKSISLSPFHFHRRFVDLLGMTPKQYLLDCQIADARSMLLEGKLQLSTIARQCGFSHQSHFTSRFKQATGFTPTRWRKAMLEQAAVR
jgi:AraC-like DNA-binding protein